jgi:hypothetical protein
MQRKLVEDADEKKRKLEQKRIEKEEEQEKKEREAKKRYFEANFKYGSTTVMKYLGVFFFKGDIAHVGKENIFYNSRKIKSMMEKNGKTMGAMNYDEPPTFYSEWSWEREERERKEIYEEALYRFVGDKIVVEDLIGQKKPIGHIYKDRLR